MDYTLTAYLAGIIDGEGCVSLGLRKGKYVTPTVQITNTYLPFIQWLTDTIPGGTVYDMKLRPGRKPVYMWRCAGAVARELIRDVEPFLRIKQAQAYVILGMPVRKPGTPLSEADFQINREAIARIRALNQRGVSIDGDSSGAAS